MKIIALLWLVALFWVAYKLTDGLIQLFTRYQLIDIPNDRSNHIVPVPRGGGIAILITFLAGCMPIVLLGHSMTYGPLYLGIALAILGIVSFRDDIKHVSVVARLMAHFAAAILGATAIQEHGLLLGLPAGIEMVLLVFAIVGFINLFNFVDGLDGLASGQAIYLALSLAYFYWLIDSHSAYIYISLVLAVVNIGFLMHNWHPARIFLGDVGSITIGFMLVILLAILAAKGHLLQALILPAYCFADAGFVLLCRIYRLEKVWVAHSQHFFQKAVRSGRTHAEVVVKIIIGNTALFVWASISFYLQTHNIITSGLEQVVALLPALAIVMMTVKLLPVPMPSLDLKCRR